MILMITSLTITSCEKDEDDKPLGDGEDIVNTTSGSTTSGNTTGTVNPVKKDTMFFVELTYTVNGKVDKSMVEIVDSNGVVKKTIKDFLYDNTTTIINDTVTYGDKIIFYIECTDSSNVDIRTTIVDNKTNIKIPQFGTNSINLYDGSYYSYDKSELDILFN